MNECERYGMLISAMLDGEITEAEKDELEVHIASCPDCRRMYEAFRFVSESVKTELAEPPKQLHESIMNEVRKRTHRKKGIVYYLRASLAAAACLAVICTAVFAFSLRAGVDNNSAASGDFIRTDITAASSEYDSSGAPESKEVQEYAEVAPPSVFDISPAEVPVPEAPESTFEIHNIEEVPISEEQLAAELDIASAVIIIDSDGNINEQPAGKNDAVIWVQALLSGSLDTGKGTTFALDITKNDGDEYSVYMFYGENGVYISDSADRSDAVCISSLSDFAEYCYGK